MLISLPYIRRVISCYHNAVLSTIGEKSAETVDNVTNNALGTNAGVRGHGAARRAGGSAAVTTRPPTHIGLGEKTDHSGDGWSIPRDGGTGDAGQIRRRRRTSRPATQYPSAGWRIWSGRASTDPSTLSASRADEKQLSASAEQVCERRAGVGGRGAPATGGRQEGRTAAEGHALVVGAHGRAAASPAALAGGAPPTATRALRHGASSRAARRLIHIPLLPLAPGLRSRITLTFHCRDDRIDRAARRPGLL